MQDHYDVVVVGAGAAGIAALRELAEFGLDAVALEARGRVGGRAHTITTTAGFAVDCGAGWVHSADQNPLAERIARAGFHLDKSPPHWLRQSLNADFPPDEQRAFRTAFGALEARIQAAAQTGVDRPAAELLEPNGRWNAMLNAFSSYYNGAEFDQVSLKDYAAYEDSGVNWRVAEGYGAAIAHFAPMERVVLDCPVGVIRRDGAALRLETAKGSPTARAAIVAVPTSVLAEGRLRFEPGLPAAIEAAAGLPLGLADKVFLGLDDPDALPVEGHLFGSTTHTETGSYHLRPFGRPYIEVFLGGRCARALEGDGGGAMAAFAIDELVRLLGGDIRVRLHPLGETHWLNDPWARGSYSHALPGHAEARRTLAQAGDGRIVFAGEACHPTLYSTVHGAWESGQAAAASVIATLG